jgi:hypothetical protein
MSMCATWYCKHVRGAVGQHFWRSVHRVLAKAEEVLSAHCVHTLDPGREALEELFPVEDSSGEPPLRVDELDGRRDPARHARLWGRWAGREQEFFRACAGIVDGLSWNDVRALGGAPLRLVEDLARQAHRALLDETVPQVLRVGPFQVLASDGESMRVASYSPFDPLELPRALADLLHRFDGRRVEHVLGTLADGDGIELDPAQVRKLVDFKILEEA